MDEGLAERPERVGVVATDPLRVLGLKTIFSESAKLEIVHLSIPGALNDANLSLVLIDAECTPHLFELIAAFRQARPQLKLMVLGGDVGEGQIERVIGAGAKGYLPLTTPETEIRTAVESVHDGSVWAPRNVISRLVENRLLDHPQSPATALPRFTARELQVLRLLRAGKSNREIAASLRIDAGTVKAHIGRLMRKVGVSNRTALTMHPLTQVE